MREVELAMNRLYLTVNVLKYHIRNAKKARNSSLICLFFIKIDIRTHSVSIFSDPVLCILLYQVTSSSSPEGGSYMQAQLN